MTCSISLDRIIGPAIVFSAIATLPPCHLAIIALTMPRATLIILERTGEWAVALRRCLDKLAAQLLETRSLDEFWLRLAEHPTALAAWELTESNVRPVTAALVRLQREFPRASAVVLSERRLAACEPLMREAGSIHFIDSPRSLRALAEIVGRRASQPPSGAAGLQQDSAENTDPLAEIWANLPWSDTH
jgi:hypothetical protein